MIATFHRIYPDNQLPERRSDLYRQICRMQLGDRPLAKRVELPLEKTEDRQRVLQAIALSMVQDNQPTIEREALLELLKSQLIRFDETVSAEVFLDRIVEVSELMVEREKDEFEFAHLMRSHFSCFSEELKISIAFSRASDPSGEGFQLPLECYRREKQATEDESP